ncbi:unnamed protein product [Linum tenue]|uniref:Reverse transcriptase zinc-binding domain-containing protein n=1 Tax=Linum tenue TaxID=586396 RepID=A0AAV0P496_9ROSI|nr:unnamed protein product [Linum tenue]
MIQGIPLACQRITDKLIWHYEASGQFSVKSAYYLASNLQGRSYSSKHQASFMDHSLWNWVWNRKVPPKLLFFSWKGIHRILPTREALVGRGLDLIPICSVCGRKEETIEHLFFTCLVARKLWRLLGFQELWRRAEKRSFTGFIRNTLSKTNGSDSDYVILQVICLFWRLWKNRCMVVFQFEQLSLDVLAHQWSHQVKEVEQALLSPTPEPRLSASLPVQVESLGLQLGGMKQLVIPMCWKP